VSWRRMVGRERGQRGGRQGAVSSQRGGEERRQHSEETDGRRQHREEASP
jgi:hypothetical protein